MSITSAAAERLVEALCDRDAANQFVNLINTGTSPVFSSDTDATHLGFFAVTAAARPTAYTQTYATATRTQSNLTYAAITDSTGGTASTTFAAITAPAANATTSLTADMVAVQNALAQIAVSLGALNTDITNVKRVLNSVIDDLQAYGLLA